MPRHFLEDTFEHGIERLVQSVTKNAVLLSLLLRRPHIFGDRLILSGMTILVPLAERYQMRLQTLDRIAKWPGIGLAFGAVLASIV